MHPSDETPSPEVVAAAPPIPALARVAAAAPVPEAPPLPELDAQGRPLSQRRPRVDRIVGPELSSKWANADFGAMTPERLRSILRNADLGRTEDWCDFCEYIIEDPDIFGVYFTRRNAVASAPWDLEPGVSADPVANRWAGPAAEFCSRVMREIPDLERTWLDQLDATGLGWSVGENLWRRDAGAWIVSDIEWTRAGRYRFDPAWKLRLYDSGIHGSDGIELPPGKFVVHVPRTRSAYPVRTGEFRVLAWYWLFHRWCLKYWLAGAERHGGPMLWAKVPNGTRADVKRRTRDLLEQMRSDAVAVVEAAEQGDISINMLEAAMSSADVFDQLCARFERGYAKALLGATLTVDVGDSGSRALGVEHSKVKVERSKTDAKLHAGAWRRDILYWLCSYNTHLFGGQMPPVPRLIRPTFEDAVVPSVSTGAGAAAGAEGAEKVADAALNGAQISSLLEIVDKVRMGLPVDAAMIVVKKSFPTFHEDEARQMLAAAAGAPIADPDASSPAPAPAPAGGAAPPPFGSAPPSQPQGSPATASSQAASPAPSSMRASSSPTTPTSSRSPMSPLARALLGASGGPKS